MVLSNTTLDQVLATLRDRGWHTAGLTDLTADSGQSWWSWHLTRRLDQHSVTGQGRTLVAALYSAAGKAHAWEIENGGTL